MWPIVSHEVDVYTQAGTHERAFARFLCCDNHHILELVGRFRGTITTNDFTAHQQVASASRAKDAIGF
jgi:hypothetical protein